VEAISAQDPARVASLRVVATYRITAQPVNHAMSYAMRWW